MRTTYPTRPTELPVHRRRRRPAVPLKLKNLDVPGGYSVTATQPAGGNLHPLRAPDAARLDDEDGTEA
ncbi:hypothetical protein ABZX40_15100 [Streptomyces sp. NPDC004610]|uniref:hypothetical protein n=1 Tax=unclassified Streptomyces TaxID=2593676 RepID=UPI0033B54BBF